MRRWPRGREWRARWRGRRPVRAPQLVSFALRPSKTGCTTSTMAPAARARAHATGASARRSWRHGATPPSACATGPGTAAALGGGATAAASPTPPCPSSAADLLKDAVALPCLAGSQGLFKVSDHIVLGRADRAARHEHRNGWAHLAATQSKNHRDRASLAAPRLTLNRPCWLAAAIVPSARVVLRYAQSAETGPNIAWCASPTPLVALSGAVVIRTVATERFSGDQ